MGTAVALFYVLSSQEETFLGLSAFSSTSTYLVAVIYVMDYISDAVLWIEILLGFVTPFYHKGVSRAPTYHPVN